MEEEILREEVSEEELDEHSGRESDVVTMGESMMPGPESGTSFYGGMQTNTTTDAVDDEEVDQLDIIGSDFFDDFELSPRPERHYNLNPDLEKYDVNLLENEMGLDPKDIDLTHLLAADHPLLDRFQKSLKEQLLKMVTSMREEVSELVEGSKLRLAEKETLGKEAFETGKSAEKQEQAINTCLKDIENMTSALEEMDFQLSKVTEEFQYEKDSTREAEREEISIRTEMESVDLLLKQMTDWEAELENELMIKQRVMDHTAKTKVELHQRQKQMNALLYNMMRQVWKIENEVETVQMQIRVKEEERERLAEAVALTNIDIESNQTEYRCLLHGWQSLIVTINKRDKYLNSLQDEYTKVEDILSSVKCELIHIKKEIHKEHIENERLTLIKDRLEYELSNVCKALRSETDKRDEHLKIEMKYNKILEENNRQRDMLKQEIGIMRGEEKKMSQDVEAQNQEKYHLEQDIINLLQSNAFNTDACRQMANLLKDCKEENRRTRINIARVEGQISHIHAEYQAQRLENIEVGKQLQEIKLVINSEDDALLNIHREFDKTEKMLSKNILYYEQLKQKASGSTAEKIEMWPQEVRIRQMEATNAELVDRNKQSQSFWLREQAIVVELYEKRQGQMKEMDLLKKQICVMDQKNLRINDTIENLERLEETLSRSIISLENKMNFCTTGLHKKRNNKSALNVANHKVQMELQIKLEDCEFESLRMKAEIVEIEDDKLALSKELVDKNREALCWEKKLLLVLETKKQMFESLSESGELSQMRTEIHRMNVRYSQLKKAQDKLIRDLDNCIYRRDSIVTLAEARTRNVKGGSQQWRVNFNKRRDELKNKIIQADQEYDEMCDKLKAHQWQIQLAEEDLKKGKEQLKALQDLHDGICKKVEKAKVDRQLNLDILLYKQKKLKVYTELLRGRTPFMAYRTQSATHKAYIRERTMNGQLRIIVNDLSNEFPEHTFFLAKCHNSLAIPDYKI